MIVAIQGERGSFSEQAAHRFVGVEIKLLCCETFTDLFAAVITGRASRGVVPVRNSIAGTVSDNEHRVVNGEFIVLQSLLLPVRQCLIVRPDLKSTLILRVASHAVALQQCAKWFAAHSDCEAIPVWDTAGAVRELMAGTLNADAVIASSVAAQIHGAEVLAEGIEDCASNATEFLLIGILSR
ncbi:MAG: prephenate dehydratase domain-containing protein [Gemmatimonadaceae bacterium]